MENILPLEEIVKIPELENLSENAKIASVNLRLNSSNIDQLNVYRNEIENSQQISENERIGLIKLIDLYKNKSNNPSKLMRFTNILLKGLSIKTLNIVSSLLGVLAVGGTLAGVFTYNNSNHVGYTLNRHINNNNRITKADSVNGVANLPAIDGYVIPKIRRTRSYIK